MNETTIVQSEYKFLKLFLHDKFYVAARVNHAVLYESLYKIRISANLEGHKIIDTGIRDKLDNLRYEIHEVLN